VVALGKVELRETLDACPYVFGVESVLVEVCFEGFPLSFVEKEDDVLVLRLLYPPLRTVLLEGHRDEVLIREPLGVVVDLKSLGVVTEVSVGRVRLRTPCVPDARSDDAVESTELCVGTPETPEGERRCFRLVGGQCFLIVFEYRRRLYRGHEFLTYWRSMCLVSLRRTSPDIYRLSHPRTPSLSCACAS